MSILKPLQVAARHKKAVVITPRTEVNDDNLENSISYYYSPDSFIKNALFLVQSENLYNQVVKRPLLYQIFYTSVQYVTDLIKCRDTVRTSPLIANPNMGEGWFFMPLDFAGWVATPVPAFYDFDQYGNWSFRFAGTLGQHTATIEMDGVIYLQYHQMPPLNGVNTGFLLLLRWHFLRELCFCQNSIAQFAQIIEARYQEYWRTYATKTVDENKNLSAKSGVRGNVNNRIGTL